jgi:hypothetical protein
MKYYLETVSVRKMVNSLDKDFIKNNCFTSIQVLSELLTDLNERNFLIKKNALNKIFNNKIFLDWEQPHKKHFESFGFFNVNYNLKKENILLIYDIIDNSISFKEFSNNIIKNKREYEVIKKYDNAFNDYFKKEIDLKNKEFRGVLSYKEGKDICDTIIEQIKINDDAFKNFHIAMCIKMAEDLFSSPLNKYNKRSVEEIIKSYNGNIDIFLIISGIYSITKVSRNEQISRNDFNDLYHLMYIKDDIIVSDDNIFSKYMNEICPDNIISCNELSTLIK